MKNVLLPLIAIILLSACGPKITSEQEKDLNELSGKVDSVVNILATDIDSNKVAFFTDKFLLNKQFFEKEMEDTLERKTIFMIDKYIQLKKPVEYLASNYFNYLRESQIMQQQIEDLEHDVENRLVDESQFKKYYDLESANYHQLEEAMKNVRMIYIRTDSTYTKLSPSIDSLVIAYKKKRNEL